MSGAFQYGAFQFGAFQESVSSVIFQPGTKGYKYPDSVLWERENSFDDDALAILLMMY